jgi:hypothetical protein
VALPGVDLDAVQGEVDRQCDALPRGSTAREALSHSCIVRVDSKVGAWRVSGFQRAVLGPMGLAPCQCASWWTSWASLHE